MQEARSGARACSVLPYWLERPRTMPLFLRMSPITAVRFAAILAAASRRAAACSSLSGAAALTDRPKIFLFWTGAASGEHSADTRYLRSRAQ